jgi:hypothetical protein
MSAAKYKQKHLVENARKQKRQQQQECKENLAALQDSRVYYFSNDLQY